MASYGEARDQFTDLSHAASGEIRYEALWGLARTQEALGNLHEAITQLDALLDAAGAGEPGAPGLLTLLNARCRIYRSAGDFARSIEVGETALRQVRELGLEGTAEEIRLASSLVGSYWARGDMFSAQHLASQVIERAEKLGSREAQGNAYWNASTVAAARGPAHAWPSSSRPRRSRCWPSRRRTATWPGCGSPTPGCCCAATRRGWRKRTRCSARPTRC